MASVIWSNQQILATTAHAARRTVVTSVRKNGVPVWYLMAKDEGHGFDKKKNQDFQFYATVLFIQRYLLN